MSYRFSWKLLGSVLVCVLGVTAAAPVATAEGAQHRPAPGRMSDFEIVRDLRRQLEQTAAEGRFSGTVAFAKYGFPLFAEAYGRANRAFGVDNEIDTRFNLASVAKMFTTTAIMQLIGEGRLSLQDTLLSVVPDYPNRTVAASVTIEQLLSMTSGMGDYANAAFGQANWLRLRRADDYLPYFVNDLLRFTPGSRDGYSNAGYLVLGMVVERVTQQSFVDYVRSRIFTTADMRNTGFFTSEDNVQNLAVGYTAGPGENAPLGVALSLGRGAEAAGGSGTYSTVHDLLRFAESVKTGRLLPPEFTDLLMRYRPFGYRHEYGWQLDYASGVYSFGHGGDWSGTSARLEIYPELGYTVAVLSNADGAAHLVSSRLNYRLSGRASPRAVAMPQQILQQFGGTYATPPSGPGGRSESLYVTVERGALFVKVPRQGTHKFLPLSATEFFDDDMLSPRLTFARDASGAVTGLTLTGIGLNAVSAARQR